MDLGSIIFKLAGQMHETKRQGSNEGYPRVHSAHQLSFSPPPAIAFIMFDIFGHDGMVVIPFRGV